jgi:hypothetical protein
MERDSNETAIHGPRISEPWTSDEHQPRVSDCVGVWVGVSEMTRTFGAKKLLTKQLLFQEQNPRAVCLLTMRHIRICGLMTALGGAPNALCRSFGRCGYP